MWSGLRVLSTGDVTSYSISYSRGNIPCLHLPLINYIHLMEVESEVETPKGRQCPPLTRMREHGASHACVTSSLAFPAQPPRRLRCSKVERAGNESSFALCRLKLEEPMFRKISYLGFNLQRKEDERWKEFRNKGYFVSGIFPIVPPVPFVSSLPPGL